MIDWWTFSHGLAFAIGGLVTLAVMLITGWRLDNGRCDRCGHMRSRRDMRPRREAVERRVSRK